MKFLRRLSPTSLVWILTHVIIVLVGYVLINVPQVVELIGETSSTGIGASLIAGGATGIVIFLYIRASEDLGSRLQSLLAAGLTQVFTARSTRIRSEYDDRISRGIEIDILGFGLSQFREDYRDKFADWSRSKRVRILLLDPKYPTEAESYSRQRDSEENNPEGRIKSDIEEFVRSVRQAGLPEGEGFQVRYMKALPSINVFRIDDEVFWGPYLIGEQSRNTITMIAQKGGFVFDQISRHFDRLWDDDNFSVDAL